MEVVMLPPQLAGYHLKLRCVVEFVRVIVDAEVKSSPNDKLLKPAAAACGGGVVHQLVETDATVIPKVLVKPEFDARESTAAMVTLYVPAVTVPFVTRVLPVSWKAFDPDMPRDPLKVPELSWTANVPTTVPLGELALIEELLSVMSVIVG
jgi:hypothetical protein